MHNYHLGTVFFFLFVRGDRESFLLQSAKDGSFIACTARVLVDGASLFHAGLGHLSSTPGATHLATEVDGLG